MKAIKLTTVAVLSTVVFGSLAVTAKADEVSYKSKGTIAYTPSTDPTNPVDPTDPTKPIDPVGPGGEKPDPGTGGPLAIDFASSFDFGTQEITSKDKEYTAAAQKVSDGSTTPNYVQVTDNRGSLGGWTLKVKQEAQFNTGKTGVGSSLDGALMTLGNGNIVSNSAQPADTFNAETKLIPGADSVTILGATNGNGAGTNLLVFGDKATESNSVKLEVPGSTTKLAEGYTTNLTWTLSDTPI